MFQMKAEVNLTALQLQRSLAQAAPGIMGQYVTTIIRPAMQEAVRQTFAVYPGPASRKFVFASPLSRRWFFANFPGGYTRTGEMSRAWEILIDRRSNEGFLTVIITDTGALYTFGNRQVSGHRNTGWGENFGQYSDEVGRLMTSMLMQGWYLVSTGQYR